MTITEITAKSILRKHKRLDTWFLSRYSMNLYRGCLHDCVYCDGRAEKYQITGQFGSDIQVKTNAIEILSKELNPHHRRLPLKPGFIMLGGGVGDSYQPVEDTYKLAHKTLTLLNRYHWPMHILTKSTRVLEDLSLIQKINSDKKAIVSFSFSSTDNKISNIFEPGVPPPDERLRTLSIFSEHNISCGMFLMPPIPFITDTKPYLEKTIKDGKEAGADFIIFGGMTLKEGKQKQYYFETLKQHYPHILPEYHTIYKQNKWGQAIPQYYHALHKTIYHLAKKYHIPLRIPQEIYKNILPDNDLVVTILDHIHYYLQLTGHRSPYGYAASQIAKIATPLSQISHELRSINGVGPTIEKNIKEILQTGSCNYYNKLISSF